jgi:subtilase family serine protease
MFRRLGFPFLSVFVLVSVFVVSPAYGREVEARPHPPPRITQSIDEGNLVRLFGNTRREAKAENDRGAVADDFRLEHMLLQLRRSPEQEQSLQQFIEELHDPNSPNFHKWLIAREFGQRFGVAPQDLNTITRWLESHGFQVNLVYPSGMVIDFSGNAGQVRTAFRTEIHRLEIKGEKHVANMSDPRIPAALAPAVTGIVSLHDFRPRTMHKARPNFTIGSFLGDYLAMAPADLATIYNLNPLFNAGYSGQGQTIVVIENSNVFSTADWGAFRSTFGLSGYTSGSFTQVHPAPPSGPNNCADPGAFAPNSAEAILDAEWASAAAPSAAIQVAACADTGITFGGLIAIQNVINAIPEAPAIMSISYGECEAVNGEAANAAFNAAYQQAAAEGVSVFVASGDSGASGCDYGASEATHGIGANALASTPHNVAVGGTDFSDTYSGTNDVYWNSTNTATFGSAKSYVPEMPWNDSCAGSLLSNYLGYGPPYGSNSLCNDPDFGEFLQNTVAGGGSPSECATGTPSSSGVVSGTCQGWPKPSWQSVFGNPNDGVRDTPDVSLFAADGFWSHFYVFCWSDTASGGAPCTGDPSGWSGAGGTSFGAPILAGIQALVNQWTGGRQGNPNPVYYELASAEFGSGGNASCNSSNGNGVASSCIFYDVTQGDIVVNCTGSNDCYNPSGPGTQGALSTSSGSFSPAYSAATGWDFATGIGTVNATNLVANWPTGEPIPNFTLSASPGSLSIMQGTSGTSTITVTPQNGFSDSVSLSASGLPAGVIASFSPNPAMATSMLTLTASSTATTGTVTVIITGVSGILANPTTVSLTVVAAPDFALSASPGSLSVYQGASGTSTVTVTPQNGFGGSVSLSASGLPSGVTASFSPNPATTTSTLTLSASGTAATGTVAVTVTGTSGSLTHTATINLTVNVAPNFPPGWLDADVGSVGTAGSAGYADGTFTVKASGRWIYDVADGMHFVYQAFSGDGTIVARVVSAQGSTYPQAGVMIRETLGAGSVHAYTTYEPYPGPSIYFFSRAGTGGTTAYQGSGISGLPYWVKLVRSGSTFTSYASSNGTNWVQVGSSRTISMSQNVYIGLAVSANNNSALVTATFDNVSVN